MDSGCAQVPPSRIHRKGVLIGGGFFCQPFMLWAMQPEIRATTWSRSSTWCSNSTRSLGSTRSYSTSQPNYRMSATRQPRRRPSLHATPSLLRHRAYHMAKYFDIHFLTTRRVRTETNGLVRAGGCILGKFAPDPYLGIEPTQTDVSLRRTGRDRVERLLVVILLQQQQVGGGF
ncbi:hypothetical protein BD413DRAFT_277268 [Trametes elegans]|nr:hypothetical protein BD413DRAFT_277268 [Trametes elegans]